MSTNLYTVENFSKSTRVKKALVTFEKSTSDFIYCIQSPYNDLGKKDIFPKNDIFSLKKISFLGTKNKCLSPHNFVCWEKKQNFKKKNVSHPTFPPRTRELAPILSRTAGVGTWCSNFVFVIDKEFCR